VEEFRPKQNKQEQFVRIFARTGMCVGCSVSTI